MKRTFTTIVCALLLVAMLAGCGSTGSTNPFDAKAKTFSDDGMQITLTTAFSEEDLEGYTVGYAADTAIVLALHETKAEFADAGAEDVTFEQYVEFVRQANSDKELVDGEPSTATRRCCMTSSTRSRTSPTATSPFSTSLTTGSGWCSSRPRRATLTPMSRASSKLPRASASAPERGDIKAPVRQTAGRGLFNCWNRSFLDRKRADRVHLSALFAKTQ